MATSTQRAQAIADAILNAAAPAAKVNRLGQAFAFQGGMLSEYNAMTNSDKSAFLVGRVRGFCVALVKQYDQAVAAEAAKEAAGAAVDTEFAETP